MNDFTYHVPTKVIFGRDTELQAGEAVRREGGHKVLVLYGGGSAVKSGLLGRVTGSLSGAGLEWEAVGGIRPNPLQGFAQQTVDRHREAGFDFVLAVGGGSVLDTAKAVAHGLARPGTPIWDYYLGRAEVTASLPKGSVLTIAAAGSETSDSAVLTNEATGEKRGLGSERNKPQFAIMNPALTCTLPPRQTACGIADIMMHTMDRYFSVDTDNAFTDAVAEALLRTTVEYGRAAMADPADYKARSEIMWCGSLSHNGLTGLGQPKDFSPHALGHELSGMFDIPHGESLSIMWPAWARYVVGSGPARFARFGRNVWGLAREDDAACAAAAIAAVEGYFRELGMPVCFSQAEMGVQSDETLRELARRCSYCGSRVVGRFQPLREPELYEIYLQANH